MVRTRWADHDDRSTSGKPHVSGKLYIDGSCTSHVFAELRRAASAIIQWSYEAPAGWKVSYPVPRTMPQTPQAAEYVALGLTRQVVDTANKADVASGCANVVKDANVGRVMATRACRMHAAINRENLGDVDWMRNSLVRKVPAHIKPDAAPEGAAREDAIGNGMADDAAKAAVKLHDQPTPIMEAQLEAQLKRAKIVVRTIAAVTQTSPPHAAGEDGTPPEDRRRESGRRGRRTFVVLCGRHVEVFHVPQADAQPYHRGQSITGAM